MSPNPCFHGTKKLCIILSNEGFYPIEEKQIDGYDDVISFMMLTNFTSHQYTNSQIQNNNTTIVLTIILKIRFSILMSLVKSH